METGRKIPQHIAIILDGNGRWAKAKGMPRNYGHAQGSKNVERICEEAWRMGIKYLTVYAFSTENWKRPESEVEYLCKLPKLFFQRYLAELKKNNIRVTFLGEIERFPNETRSVITTAVEQTKDNTGLILCLAVNYGGRREITLAAQRYAADVVRGIADAAIDEEAFGHYMMSEGMPELDLMIRTSGELRISNFLLWQLAYAELIFTPVAWPDFDRDCLVEAIDEYTHRNRRFGGL